MLGQPKMAQIPRTYEKVAPIWHKPSKNQKRLSIV